MADPVLPLKGDSTGHVNEAAIVAVGLATAEVFSSMDDVAPEGIHEATPETGNDSVENGTTLDIEPQREHEDDVTAPETDTLPDIDSSLLNDSTPVSLVLEPEISLSQTELVTERHVETISTATETNGVPTDVEVQPETAPNAQNDIEVQTQADDKFNRKDEPIPESDIAHHIETADAESSFEDVPTLSTKESGNTVQLEPEVDFVAPAEEEPSAITRVVAEDLLPKIEAPGEITSFVVANVGAPVDVRSEQHSAVVETSCTDELAEVILPRDVESPETLTALVEPSYKSPDDEMKEVSVLSHSQCIPSYNLTLCEEPRCPRSECPRARNSSFW